MDCLLYTVWARREQITWVTTLSAGAEEKIHLLPEHFLTHVWTLIKSDKAGVLWGKNPPLWPHNSSVQSQHEDMINDKINAYIFLPHSKFDNDVRL